MNLPRLLLLIYCGIILFIFSGCNDAPDLVGSPVLPPEDYGLSAGSSGAIRVDTFFTTVEQPVSPTLLFTGSIDRMMLGNFHAGQNQTYNAWICLRFYNLPDSLLGATITSAAIQLKPFYHFGDSLSSLSIEAFRAKANIMRDSITYDSLDINSGYYYDGIHINSPTTLQPSDTLCLIGLDTSVVHEWFISNIDTTNRNYGVILRPVNTNVIKGFYSCNTSDIESLPTLIVSYVDTNGNTGTYSHLAGISRYVSHVESNLFVNNSDGKMRVQNGISYHGILAFADLSLPWSAPWSISIHKAVLQITLDSASSSLRFTPFKSDLLYGLSVGAENVEGYYTTSINSINSDGQRTYQFDVAGLVPSWLKNTSTRKFAFSGNFESGSFDLFTFYGAGSTIIQRPKIIITYSIKR